MTSPATTDAEAPAAFEPRSPQLNLASNETDRIQDIDSHLAILNRRGLRNGHIGHVGMVTRFILTELKRFGDTNIAAVHIDDIRNRLGRGALGHDTKAFLDALPDAWVVAEEVAGL